jgi:virginiamycin B lyase
MRPVKRRLPQVVALVAGCVAIVLAAGCVTENPPPPPPPPAPPVLPPGLVVQPSYFAEDTQGNLWFTLLGIPKIARMDRSGAVTEYSLPPVSFGANIVFGSDGNLWMVGITTFGSAIGGSLVKTVPNGGSTMYELPANWVPEGLASGPDGNLWFTAWQGADPAGPVAIGRLTLQGAVTIFPLPEQGSGPASITSGPQRSLWFTESPVGRIGRAALDGKVTEFRLPRKGALPAQIASGSDGNLWFTENFSDKLARMTPDGVVTEFTLPLRGQFEAIVSGADGNLWIAMNHPGHTPNSTAGAIIRITTNGRVSVFEIPSGADVTNLVARRDGTLTFSERWVTGGPTNLGQISAAGQITETQLKLPQ